MKLHINDSTKSTITPFNYYVFIFLTARKTSALQRGENGTEQLFLKFHR